MTPQDEFVARLRRHRERNKVSIEAIASRSRIKSELIEALERNDLSDWPRGLYARAWIRAYAGAVGLDPTDTVEEFCRLFPHGDRRTGGMLQEVAAIVAHPSEYRDEFDHGVDRRRAGAPADELRSSARAASMPRTVQALWARIAALKPSLTPRLKGTPSS